MRVLTIGQPDSSHSVSFIRRLRENYPEAKFWFFASSPFSFAPELSDLCDKLIRSEIPAVYYQAYWEDMYRSPLSRFSGSVALLSSTIDEFKPDFINVNAIQDAGYLLLDSINQGKLAHRNFVCNLFVWGNDLFYFQHHPLHRQKICEFLQYVDNLIPESSREHPLAYRLGFRGRTFPPVEATLVTFEELTRSFASVQVQKENLILVKSAYQSGRTLNGVALRALSNLSDLLKNWSVVLISPSLEDWRCLLGPSGDPAINVRWSSGHLSKQDFLQFLNAAKVFVSLNLSDGVSNSFLECCAARTYPILSNSSCIVDWGSESALQLDPYDAPRGEEQLRDFFVNIEGKVDGLVAKNFVSLKRYSADEVNKIVRLIFG